MAAIKMLDVSSNNHPQQQSINWPDVHHAGYSAAMVKASEGTNYVNPWRVSDGHGAAAAGMLIGYYHFARPNEDDAVAQAEYAIDAIDRLPRSIGLALDLEIANGLDHGQLKEWAAKFLDTVTAHKIVAAPIYCEASWASWLLPAVDHPLWLASWGKPPRYKVWAWQSGQQYVAGVPGEPADVGLFYG